MKFIKRFCDPFLPHLLYFCVFVCFSYVAISYFFWLMPRSFWYVYYDIKPAHNTMHPDNMHFEAVFTRKKDGDFVYYDTLWCRNVGKEFFHRYSQQRIDDLGAIATDGKVTIFFPYSGEAPDEGECFLRSKIVDHLPLNHTKLQVLDGLTKKHIFRLSVSVPLLHPDY